MNNDRNAYTALADAYEHQARSQAPAEDESHGPLFAQSSAASFAIALALVFACAVLAWVLPMGPQ